MVKNLSIFLLVIIIGCTGEIVLPDQQSANQPPEYNLLVKLLPPVANQSAAEPDSNTTLGKYPIEVYIRQLDFSDPSVVYRMVVTLPDELIGFVSYQGERYESGDWIEVPYTDFSNRRIVLEVFTSATSAFTVDLQCEDTAGQTRQEALTLSPVLNTVLRYPQYNFRLYQQPLSEVGQYPVAVYIKQLDFEEPAVSYTLQLSFPQDSDSYVAYRGQRYRSGDWITVTYADFSDHTLPLTILTSRPAGFTLQVSCRDGVEGTQQASLTLVGPEFNLRLRQVATYHEDTTQTADTLAAASDSTVATINQGIDTLVLEVYLRQQGSTSRRQPYEFTVSVPATMDTEILFDRQRYRPGDVISTQYDRFDSLNTIDFGLLVSDTLSAASSWNVTVQATDTMGKRVSKNISLTNSFTP